MEKEVEIIKGKSKGRGFPPLHETKVVNHNKVASCSKNVVPEEVVQNFLRDLDATYVDNGPNTNGWKKIFADDGIQDEFRLQRTLSTLPKKLKTQANAIRELVKSRLETRYPDYVLSPGNV
jgi:hypothetical protein